MNRVDLIINNSLIITMNKQMDILENHALVVDKGKILDILPDPLVSEQYISDEQIDATGCFVLPGFINAHTHIPMTYFRGLADDLPLKIWLEKYIWPCEAKFLSPEFVYDATLHGCAELIRNGVTLYNDMYFYGREIAKASIKAGLKAIISEVALDFSVANCHNTEENFKYLEENIALFKDIDLVSFSIGPHSIYACSTDTLKKCKNQADKLNCLVHTHLSETDFEINYCQEHFHKKPVEYLEEIGLLENRLVLAHGVWISEDEMDLLRKHQISVIINTESNLKLASGFAPLKSYLSKEINLCLGTDGVASNNNLSLFDEMSITAKVQKCYHQDPAFLNAKTMLSMATIQAAQALGMQDRTGSLEKGKDADIQILKTDRAEDLPYYDPYSHIVYSLNNKNVRSVLVKGNILLQDGKLMTINEDEIIDKSLWYKRKIKEQL